MTYYIEYPATRVWIILVIVLYTPESRPSKACNNTYM